MKKVSVLVAVYNAQAFLAACLESLLRQTLSEIEVLCVDDASTDRSLEILSDYAQRDSRIKVFRQTENRGQAVARNIALKQATGEYTCFLDSDDWLAEDALERAVNVFEMHPETDSVLFSLVNVHADGTQTEYPMQPFEVMSGYDAFLRSMKWSIHGVYMVRTVLHQTYPYDEACHTYSDDNTTHIHYYHSREVRCCQGRYYYRQHLHSATHSVDFHRFDHLRANESMRRQLADMEVPMQVLADYEELRWRVVVDCYYTYYNNRCRMEHELRRHALSEIRRAWKTIDAKMLPRTLKYKFGYMPLSFSWTCFRLQEEVYFALRGLLGRNA